MTKLIITKSSPRDPVSEVYGCLKGLQKSTDEIMVELKRPAVIVADFLIGSHAQTQADRFLTRDRGFYKAYFKNLKIVK